MFFGFTNRTSTSALQLPGQCFSFSPSRMTRMPLFSEEGSHGPTRSESHVILATLQVANFENLMFYNRFDRYIGVFSNVMSDGPAWKGVIGVLLGTGLTRT
jgi:hypothetical protein